jgi:hypothetical protein
LIISPEEVLYREMEGRVISFLEKEGINISNIDDHEDSNT